MILEAQSLKLQYGTKTIIEEMNFSVENSEIISIIGPNGSGKSTLLKSLGRLLVPTKGKVLLRETDIFHMEISKFTRKVAIVPQSASAPGDMTVYDIVAYGRMPYQKLFGDRSQIDEAAIEEAMIKTGVSHMKYHQLDALSGGERQRVWLALALAQKPEILLLDEPTTYLDIHHQLELMHLVQNLQQMLNITVIMVLHDLNHAARFSHRLVAVKQGKILADGKVEDVFTTETLRELYGVEPNIMRIQQGGKEQLVCFPQECCLKTGA